MGKQDKELGSITEPRGFPGGASGKEPSRDIRDMSSIPGSKRSSGGGYGNPLQYCCLGNPMNRGVWRVTVHAVANNQT